MQVENHVRYFLLNIIMIPKISIINKKVGILTITNKQFGNLQLFHEKKIAHPNSPGQQLELF